jgi:hypothetical protein
MERRIWEKGLWSSGFLTSLGVLLGRSLLVQCGPATEQKPLPLLPVLIDPPLAARLTSTIWTKPVYHFEKRGKAGEAAALKGA